MITMETRTHDDQQVMYYLVDDGVAVFKSPDRAVADKVLIACDKYTLWLAKTTAAMRKSFTVAFEPAEQARLQQMFDHLSMPLPVKGEKQCPRCGFYTLEFMTLKCGHVFCDCCVIGDVEVCEECGEPAGKMVE